MDKLEKAIKGLECHINGICDYDKSFCPYRGERENCITKILSDAFELLKKQKPTIQSNGSCPNCGLDFENGDLDFSNLDSQKFYCPNCGQAVKWE